MVLVPALEPFQMGAVDGCSNQLCVVDGPFLEPPDVIGPELAPDRSLQLAASPGGRFLSPCLECRRIGMSGIQRIEPADELGVVVSQNHLVVPAIGGLASPAAVPSLLEERLGRP